MVVRRNFLLALVAATFTCIIVLQVSLDGWILRGTVRYTVSEEKRVPTEALVKTGLSNDVDSSNRSSPSGDVNEPVPSFPISAQSPLVILNTSGDLLRQEPSLEKASVSPQPESIVIGNVTTSNRSLNLQESLSNVSSGLPAQPVSFSVELKSTLPSQSARFVTDGPPQQASLSVSPSSLLHLPVLPSASGGLFEPQLSPLSSNASQLPELSSEKSVLLLSTLPAELEHENTSAKHFVDIRQLEAASPNQTQVSNINVEARMKIRSFDDHMRSRGILQRKQPQEYINPQERLKEILKQSNTMQIRSRADPLRSLRSIPTVKPENVTHVILLTYFRSGSTFVGDLLQQNWRTFYHFEPLHFMTYDSRIGGTKLQEAFDLFGSILRCNFSSQEDYLRWAKRPDNQFLFERNIFLWFTCKSNPKMCFTPEMVSAVCQRAPVQVMKVTRLNMRDLREFLSQNPDIKTKVVYLARDPRGIISSRRTLDWCTDTQCSDPHFLCREMMDDLEVFNELQETEPDKFIQVLYEDIALYPEREAKRLFQFLGLPFSVSVQRFLRTHTTARKTDGLNPYSTRRNSSSMAFSWRSRLSFPQVNLIQATCSEVLHKLNYSFINSRREFYSLRGIKSPGNNDIPSLKTIPRNQGGHRLEVVNDTSSARVIDKQPNYRERDTSVLAKGYAFAQSSLEAPQNSEKNSFKEVDPVPHSANSLSAVGRLSAISRLHRQKRILHTDEHIVNNR